MAKSAVARLGDVKRGMIKRRRKTEMVSNAISAVGTAATFAAGQFDKAKTAWGEYEKGYEALGGEGFERPKFGQKGFFKGPTGDVQIGDMMYDRSKIQEAGSFLGSDAASVLDEGARSKYLKRTAPGRLVPGLGSAPATGPHIYSDVEIEKMTGGGKTVSGVKLGQTGGIGVSAGFGQGSKGQFLDEARRQKVQTDRLAMEAELAGWEAHNKARGQLDIDIRKDEQDKILENYRSKTYKPTVPTFSPEFSKKVETEMTAYREWEARNAEQQENIRINKAKEDELARQFYNQNPKRNYLKTWEESNGY